MESLCFLWLLFKTVTYKLKINKIAKKISANDFNFMVCQSFSVTKQCKERNKNYGKFKSNFETETKTKT